MYYAANNIDKIVRENFFSNKTDGFFLDIGAFDGISINNTFHFEESGWNGICFEPFPEIYKELAKNRKCKTINKALSNKTETRKFFKIDGYSSTLSGFVDTYTQEHIERIVREIEEKNQTYDYIDVECTTFSDEIKEKEIDLLSIDTEGSELMILESIDFSYYYIKVMVLEYNYHNQKILNLLNNNGFEILKQIGVDLIIKNSKFIP